MAGYSGTPLAQKLGLRAGARVHLAHAPRDLRGALEPLPADVVFVRDATRSGAAGLDVIVLFVKDAAQLAREFPSLTEALQPAGGLWVAWPKKASGVATDVTFEIVQRIGLDTGLVDNKVCAIDDTWTGLRFVVRKADRPKR